MNSNKTTTELGIQDAAAQTEKKGAERSSIKAAQKHVLDFLLECEPYQADAVRAIAVFASDKNKPTAIGTDDAVYVNRYLSANADANVIKDVSAMSSYRNARLMKLLDSVKLFCEVDDVPRVMMAVVNIAINPDDVKRSFERLKSQQPK